MTNDLFRDLLEGRTELPLWRANFLMGITGPNRIAILPTADTGATFLPETKED